MITNLTSYVINSYYCTPVSGQTSQVYYNFDIPQSYLENISHVSVVSVSIPATWYQMAPSDFIILIENGDENKIEYSDGSYYSKAELIIDLQKKLNAASTVFTYTVIDDDTIADIKLNAIRITCSSAIANVAIKISDNHMRLLYGLKEMNQFVGGVLLSTTINLTPISTLYVHSSACTSFNNGGIMSSDIIASLNIIGGNVSTLNPLGINTFAHFDLKGNMKEFSGQKNIMLSITDFDNEVIDLNGNNWDIQICLFKYQETWLEKLNLFIEYELIKDHVKDKNYGIVQNY